MTTRPERRKGKRIAAKGIYRDPVRSSDSHFVKVSGLRWLSLMQKRRDAVVAASVGTAVLHSLSAIGTLQPNAQPPSQEINGLGASDDGSSATVVATALNCRYIILTGFFDVPVENSADKG